jgi:hypothetical protein
MFIEFPNVVPVSVLLGKYHRKILLFGISQKINIQWPSFFSRRFPLVLSKWGQVEHDNFFSFFCCSPVAYRASPSFSGWQICGNFRRAICKNCLIMIHYF